MMNRVNNCWLAVLLALNGSRLFAAMPVNDETRTNRPGIVVPPPLGAAAQKETAMLDILRFRNADVLRGNLLGLSATDGLRWAHPQGKIPLSFELAGLHEIQFGAPAQVRSGAVARVRLTNGDALPGELVGLDPDVLQLQTWYAGLVKIKRPMLAAIEPNTSHGSQLYAGPKSLAEWERPNRGGNVGWTFRKGALVSPAGGGGQNIGRDVKLPDLVSIECELAWQAYPGLNLLMYVDNFDNYYQSECYGLQISGSSIYLQRATRQNGMNNVEAAINFEGLQRRNKARIGLKVDKTKRTFALFVDGKFVKQWTDDNPFEGRGTGLGFAPQGNPLRISNIVISQWDGRLDLENTARQGEEDFIRLVNGDKLSGKLGNIANSQVALTTSYATMQVPLARIAEITLASNGAAKPRRQQADVQAVFPDGGRLTLALEKLGPQELTGTSESYGKLTAQSAAFHKIQFNLYEPKPEGEEDDDWTVAPSTGRGLRGARLQAVE